MFTVHKIESLDDPALQPYRTMRRQIEHREQGIFVAEGEKVVRRLLESRFAVVSMLLPPKWLEDIKPLLQERPEQIEVYVAEKSTLETLTGFSMYQGLLAIGKVPTQRPLEEMLAEAASPRLLVAVDSLSSAQNVGSLVRNCAAFQAHLFISGETSTSPFVRRAVRGSMGTIFHLPVFESPNLCSTLLELKRKGIRCIGAHPRAAGPEVSDVDLASDCCIVFGSEGYGLAPATLASCDEAAAIPMPQGIDSLNVSSAAAVFLYEASRQRSLHRNSAHH
jgi:tRNA G18 (ribose-2'-O)-methylase SpoU